MDKIEVTVSLLNSILNSGSPETVRNDEVASELVERARTMQNGFQSIMTGAASEEDLVKAVDLSERLQACIVAYEDLVDRDNSTYQANQATIEATSIPLAANGNAVNAAPPLQNYSFAPQPNNSAFIPLAEQQPYTAFLPVSSTTQVTAI